MILQYFIAIVPPDNYKKEIIKFQNQWISVNQEPHITVKAQGGLNSDTTWLEDIKKVCNNFQSFYLSITEPTFFGKSVLFQGVESKEVFELHHKLVKSVAPSEDLIKRYFELGDFTPHLTLGQTNWGLTEKDLEAMSNKAKTQLRPYHPTFEVNYIRVYKEVEPNRYDVFLDIPLKE